MEYWKLGPILKAQDFLIKLYFLFCNLKIIHFLGDVYLLVCFIIPLTQVCICTYMYLLMTLVCICTNDSGVYLLSEFWVGGPPVGGDQQESTHPPGRLPHPVGALCQAGQQDVCGGVSTSGKKPHIDHNTIYPAITGTINVFGSTVIFTLYNNSVE